MITFTYRVIPTGRLVWGSGIPSRGNNLITMDYFHWGKSVNTVSSLETMGRGIVMIGKFNCRASLEFHREMYEVQ